MRFYCYWLLFLTVNIAFSQEVQEVVTYPAPMIAVDSLYREDQFYLTISYNSLLNTPDGVSQDKFSSGFKAGVLRDFPINKKRNVAIAPGLGLSFNKYFQNLIISKVDGVPVYNTPDYGVDFKKNKFEQLFVDVPIEFRWRTSVPETHKFWRVYSGLQLSYLVYNKSVYVDDQYHFNVSSNSDFNKFQAGVYLAAGYNTWNFYAYYGLLPIFKSSAKVNGQEVGLHALNFGLMFYIL